MGGTQHLSNERSMTHEMNPDKANNDAQFFNVNDPTNDLKDQDSEDDNDTNNRRPQIEDLVQPDEVDPYYKFATPTYI